MKRNSRPFVLRFLTFPFHALPYKKFTDMLSYKLALAGVNLVYQKESFSSQCSPLVPSVSKKYAVPKQRVSRGLYNDSGRIFNADAVGPITFCVWLARENLSPCLTGSQKYLCSFGSSIGGVNPPQSSPQGRFGI